MKKKLSPYYLYLEPYLQTGDEEAIQKAKSDYKSQYKKNWRKEFRKANTEITTSWSKEEYRDLQKVAKEHRLSTTKYIKLATIAYGNKRYIVPNTKEVNKGIQLLAMTYNTIDAMSEELKDTTMQELKLIIEVLEKRIRELLFSPNTIEQELQKLLETEPNKKEHLLHFIQSL